MGMIRRFDLKGLVRKNVAALQPYSSARDEYTSDGSKMVFLDANENPNPNGVNRYPDPQQRDLKSVLSRSKGLAPSQILLGNGSDEILDLLFRAFCEPHLDNIITLPPTYGMYKVLAGINAVENREIILTGDLEPDVEGILNRADGQSKILFLCSPNNPTGNRFADERIERLLGDFGGLVVIDEAYIDFSEGYSWVSRLSEFPNLVVTQTLSKAYGMAGIRLGLCMASMEIIALLNKIKPPYNVNELTQQRAMERLADIGTVSSEVTEILRERDRLRSALGQIEFVSRIYPTDANFILVRVDDAERRYNQLLQHGIVVRNRSNQPRCENTLRLTIGTKEENEHLIAVLRRL